MRHSLPHSPERSYRTGVILGSPSAKFGAVPVSVLRAAASRELKNAPFYPSPFLALAHGLCIDPFGKVGMQPCSIW